MMTTKIDPLRSAQMALIRGKDTRPELVVRHLVDDLRFKYKANSNEAFGKPDLAFPRRKKAIFVHGCFWHQHAKPSCWRSRLPKTRREFWLPKLEKNVIRDKRQLAKLRRMGWKALIIWECETIVSNRSRLRDRIQRFLRN